MEIAHCALNIRPFHLISFYDFLLLCPNTLLDWCDRTRKEKLDNEPSVSPGHSLIPAIKAMWLFSYKAAIKKSVKAYLLASVLFLFFV